MTRTSLNQMFYFSIVAVCLTNLSCVSIGAGAGYEMGAAKAIGKGDSSLDQTITNGRLWAYSYVDFYYVETSFGFGFGTKDSPYAYWEYGGVTYDMRIFSDADDTAIIFDIYGKYPFKIGKVSLYPMGGLWFNFMESDYSRTWTKFGAGIEIPILDLYSIIKIEYLYGIPLGFKADEYAEKTYTDRSFKPGYNHTVRVLWGLGGI